MAKPIPMQKNGARRGPMRPKAKKGTLKRVLSLLFSKNKKSLAVVFVCLTISAVTGVASSVFLKNL